ncbi:MAG: hypothetical protein EP341_00420, partial [Sphingomonadales bacterium]
MRFLALVPIAGLLACSPFSGNQQEDGGANPAVQSPARLSVNLDATGITVPAQGDIETNIIPFGTVRANAEDALHAALGSVKDRQGNAGCPAGPMSSTKYDGITLNFQKDKFVGWY